jgi:long-chain acyl-CoA synthetase
VSRPKVATSEATHLGQLAEQSFERVGDQPALVFEGRWYSSGELLERSRRIAAGLLKLGLEPGDRVVVSMQNAPEVPVLYNAIWRAGGVVTPAMFLLPRDDLRHVIANAGARMVVTSAEFIEKVQSAVDGLDHVAQIVGLEPDVAGTVPLAELEAAAPGAVVGRAPSDLAALLYTGGTTGRSKGVMLSHENFLFTSRVFADYVAQLDIGRELLTLPLSHSFGLLATITPLQRDVATMWALERRFDPTTALELIQEHALDMLQAVPSMIQMLLAQPVEEFDLSSLRAIFSGGASLPAEVFREFQARVPSATILEGYGLTETTTLLTCTLPGRERSGCAGSALPGVEIRVVDGEGRPLPVGEVGEICTRSRAIMVGYWDAPQLTAETIRDGWLATGDIGRVDHDGNVFILDRKKDLIIRGGFNVYPGDVEDALLRHPAVQMAAVVGRPDPDHGEEVVAFLSLEAGAELGPEEMIAWGRENVGGYKYPREVHLLDTIPLTDVGKIDRKALRALLG